MKVYQTNEIKNISLLGSKGSGKTTLAEAMLYECGVIKRRGTVEAGNTVCDYFPVEKEFGYSVFSTIFYAEFLGKKINVIDCPEPTTSSVTPSRPLTSPTPASSSSTHSMVSRSARRTSSAPPLRLTNPSSSPSTNSTARKPTMTTSSSRCVKFSARRSCPSSIPSSVARASTP